MSSDIARFTVNFLIIPLPPGRFYCTVTCSVAVGVIDPEVAVTVTVLVPAGVPGFGVVPPPPPSPPPPLPPLPPPHPTSAPPRMKAKSSKNQPLQPATRLAPGITKRSKQPSAKSPVIPARRMPPRTEDCAAIVEIVRVVVTALPLGVTVAGAKVQVASDGRPLQAKVTGCAKPPAGVTEIVVVPVAPDVMERLVGLALRVKEAGTAA